jgi:hypothetical protein
MLKIWRILLGALCQLDQTARATSSPSSSFEESRGQGLAIQIHSSLSPRQRQQLEEFTKSREIEKVAGMMTVRIDCSDRDLI